MKKRLLALLLAVCMAASLFAVTAGAEDPAVTLVSVQSMGGNQLLLTFSAAGFVFISRAQTARKDAGPLLCHTAENVFGKRIRAR